MPSQQQKSAIELAYKGIWGMAQLFVTKFVILICQNFPD